MDTLQFTGKPESSAPHTATGERHLDHPTNAEARRVIEPVIEHYLRGRYSDSYWLLEVAPTQARSWRSGTNIEANESAWRYARAIAEVEAEVERRNPGVELTVSVSPHEEPADNPRHAQRLDAAHSRRKVVAEIEAVEAEHGCTRKAAMGILQDRYGWSVPKQRKAIEEVNRERGEERGEPLGDGDAA